MTGAWLFARQGQTLAVHRRTGTSLEVDVDGETMWHRSYEFASEVELQEFLARLEEHLLEAGWTFQRFESEDDRRAHVERRSGT